MLLENKLYLHDIDKIATQSYDWSKIDGHSVLIIGASGMIGSCLVDILMHRNKKFHAGINIYAMGRSLERLKMRFGAYLDCSLFHLVEGDITKELPSDLKVDYLIHGASNTHPRAYATDPIGTIMTNLLGNQNVLSHAVKTNAKRSIFLSTVEVYGENTTDVDRFKEDEFGFIDCNTLRAGYPESKRVSESLCQAYISKYGIDIVIPRLARTFGPTMLMNDSKASSQFILKAAADEDIVLKSDGLQQYSYTYVCDAASALLYLLINGENGEAYNIATPSFDIRLKDLAGKLAEITERKVIFELPDQEEAKGFSKATKAMLDATKLHDLGWKSLFTLEESLENTVKIIRDVK